MILYSPKEVQGKPDSMIVQRRPLVGFYGVHTTSSAKVKLLCCLYYDKSICGVLTLDNSQSWGIRAAFWDDTLEYEGSLRTSMIVC